MSSGPTAAGNHVTPETALNCQDVMACQRVLAETIGMIPVYIYRRDLNGSSEIAYEHSLFRIFNQAPNPETTKFTWMEMMMVDLVGWGYSINQVVWTQTDRVHAIWRLDPSQVKIERNESGELIYVLRRKDGSKKVFSTKDIFIVVGPFGGRSLISLARESIGSSIAATEYGARFFSNDATPNLAISVPDVLDDDSYKRMEKSWNLNHQGVGRSHRMTILEQGAKVEQLGLSPEDSQFLATRRFTKEEIAGWFRIPPHLIGSNEANRYSNHEQAAIDAVMNAYMPWFTRIEQAAKIKFFPTQRYFLEFEESELLRGDVAARADWNSKMLQHGVLTINEVRKQLKRNPTTGKVGNVHVIQGAMVDGERIATGEWPKVAADPQKIEPKPQEQQPEPEEVNSAEDMEIRAAELEKRAISNRSSLRVQWRPKFKVLGQKVIDSEVLGLRKGIKQFRDKCSSEIAALTGKKIASRRIRIKTRTVEEFKEWAREFYRVHSGLVAIQVRTLIEAYALDAGELAAQQIEESAPDMKEFITDITESVTDRHISVSLGQIVTKTDGKKLETFDEIDGRLDAWEKDRSEKIANSLTVRIAEAAAVMVFLFFGHDLIWRTQSDACANCKMLDGTIVGRDGYFAAVGQLIDSGDGKTEPIHVKANFKNPPLHRSCECFIMPGL